MTSKSFGGGFTVVELMVSLAVAAILFGLALPAFNDLMDQRTMTTQINRFVLAVNYARSEAVKLGGVTSVQSIDASDSDNEWGAGYCVVVGNPGNCNNALQTFAAPDGETLNGIDGLADVATLSFNSRGLWIGGAAGEVQLCSTDAEVDPGRSIFINTTGRASIAELVCNP